MKRALGILLSLLFVISCTTQPAPVGKLYDHVVVVFEENKSASQVRDLPYLAQLRAEGFEFINSFAICHPSQPNYIAFFSGSQNGVTTDADYTIAAPNLFTRLDGLGIHLLSYSEALPEAGYRGAVSGRYVKKHNPVASFSTVPDSINRPFTEFPTDPAGFSALPAIAFVIPDLDDDMHDGTPEAADQWLRQNLDAYVQWAMSHRSLLIVTFDEPVGGADPATTPILTIFAGSGLRPGAASSQRVTHYTFLKFLLDEYGAASLGLDAGEPEIIFP